MNEFIAHWMSRRWLSAYLDGELAGARLQGIRRHVDLCRRCQSDLERIRRGRDALVRCEGLRQSEMPFAASRSGFWPLRWAGISALVVIIIVASAGLGSLGWLSRWWPSSSAQAMSISFYAAQFENEAYCVSPCTSLAEISVDELRHDGPFPAQYPGWLPKGMTVRRVIRYRTTRHEGVGLIFAGKGKKFSLFEQPRKLGLATNGRPTSEARICGRKCIRVNGGNMELFQWVKDDICFVVATDLARSDIEAIVDSLRPLSKKQGQGD